MSRRFWACASGTLASSAATQNKYPHTLRGPGGSKCHIDEETCGDGTLRHVEPGYQCGVGKEFTDIPEVPPCIGLPVVRLEVARSAVLSVDQHVERGPVLRVARRGGN